MTTLLVILSFLAFAKTPESETIKINFEKRLDQQITTLLQQNPDVRWPKIDMTFKGYVNMTSLDYSDQNSINIKILSFCQVVSELYQNKVIKAFKLPQNGSYFLQSCILVDAQLQGGGVVFDQKNIGLVDQFVLLQHHSTLTTLLRSPYFATMQEVRNFQLAYQNTLLGSIGISLKIFYNLTQAAVLLVFGFFVFKLFNYLVA